MVKFVIAITGFHLLVFGMWYAAHIYFRPTRPTWLSVVIGVGVTLVGIAVMQYACLRQLATAQVAITIVAIAPASFFITGMPMIYYQHRKNEFYKEEAKNATETALANTGKSSAKVIHSGSGNYCGESANGAGITQ